MLHVMRDTLIVLRDRAAVRDVSCPNVLGTCVPPRDGGSDDERSRRSALLFAGMNATISLPSLCILAHVLCTKNEKRLGAQSHKK